MGIKMPHLTIEKTKTWEQVESTTFELLKAISQREGEQITELLVVLSLLVAHLETE